ncbi:hypothetical protein [Caudoviricetes sp.]|nr:hypothetical protein [Caudoviricetes sp.]
MADTELPGGLQEDLSGLTEIDLLKQARRALLEKWLREAKAGTLSSTDAASLARLASQNGWVLDETRLPSRLKDKLTQHHDPSTLDQDDKVLPIRKAK